MKIGILTFHCAHNYGAVLQAYAMQEKLISMGHEVEFINYTPEIIKNRNSFFKLNGTTGILHFFKRLLSNCIYLPKSYKRYTGFTKFIVDNFKLSKETFNKKINCPMSKYDAYIFGSDQIWNFKYRGFDENYYGEFKTTNDAIKIGYGNSLEVDNFTLEHLATLKQYLNNFDAISLREENLISILQPLTKTTIYPVVDPTLLVPRNVFDKIAGVPKIKTKYIIVYQVIPVEGVISIAKKIAIKFNARLIVLTAGIESWKIQRSIKSTISPGEFIGFFKNAECVITTSFHGTVFSLIYNKPFYVITAEAFGNRIKDLLARLQLDDRIITSLNDVTFSKINYRVVNQKINELRIESETFLSDSLKLQ